MNNSQKGFTMVEMIIVVLLIGIMSSIAIPNYRNYVVKAKLTNIVAMAEQIHQEQAKYLLENGHYALSLQQLDPQGLIAGSNMLADELADYRQRTNGSNAAHAVRVGGGFVCSFRAGRRGKSGTHYLIDFKLKNKARTFIGNSKYSEYKRFQASDINMQGRWSNQAGRSVGKL